MRQSSPMNLKDISKKIGIAGVTAFVVALGFFAGLYVNAEKFTINLGGASKSSPTLDLDLFWKAYSILNDKYVPTATSSAAISDQDKLYGAIKGLAESYGDPYTTFLNTKESKNLTSDLSGSLEGIGAILAIKDGKLTAISIIKGSPAENGSLLGGDRIQKIDGDSTQAMDIETAVNKIRGKKGTAVSLTIERDNVGAPFIIRIVRDTITAPVVEGKLYSGGVFVIKVASFTSNLSDLFRNALRDYRNSGATRLIIDLRNNTGGYLDAAVDMASWFLPTGKVIVTEDFAGKQDPIIYRSRGYDLFAPKQRVVILVNEYSASASEIFAGALHDSAEAILVGEKTFGKGSVQELVPLTEDTMLKITIARWLTPAGISISHNGITPDFVVGLNIDDIKAGKDPQLDKALEVAGRL